MTNEMVYRDILDNLYEGLYFVDLNRTITYWNKGAERLSGYSSDEVVGSSCKDNILVHIDSKGEHLCLNKCPLAKTMEDGHHRENLVYMHHKGGHRVPVYVSTSPIVENQRIVGAVEVFRKVDDKLVDLDTLEKYRNLALIDSLTEAANRRFLEMKLVSALAEYERYGMIFGLIFLDIDFFKNVNDTYGHTVGDLVLKMIANTLKGNTRSVDFFARWGGEEFIIIVKQVEMGELAEIAEKLRVLVSGATMLREDKTIEVTISLGATLATTEDTVESIVERADKLMYQSKLGGRNRVTIG